MACGLAVHPCPAGEEARMPYNPSYTTYLFFCTKNNISNSIRDAREFHFQIQFAVRERHAQPGTSRRASASRVRRRWSPASRGRRSAEPRRAPRRRGPPRCVCVCVQLQVAGARCDSEVGVGILLFFVSNHHDPCGLFATTHPASRASRRSPLHRHRTARTRPDDGRDAMQARALSTLSRRLVSRLARDSGHFHTASRKSCHRPDPATHAARGTPLLSTLSSSQTDRDARREVVLTTSLLLARKHSRECFTTRIQPARLCSEDPPLCAACCKPWSSHEASSAPLASARNQRQRVWPKALARAQRG